MKLEEMVMTIKIMTTTTTNLDTRLKNLENQENQTVWDFGTY